MPHGILVIDKASGMTSHDVVNCIRRIFHTKRVGHTGTLDPEATGVLVLCLGNGLRLAEYLSAEQKKYTAEITFGIETDTQDIWGAVVSEFDASGLTEADVIRALAGFRGTIYQIPPMVSARRFEGKHLYELARQGVTVERQPRAVEVIELEITRFTAGARPSAELQVTCSTGTYIRTLAYDIGRVLGVGASMSALRRTLVGSGDAAFTLQQAHTIDELSVRGIEDLLQLLLPPDYAVRSWHRATIDAGLEQRIRNGQAITLEEAGFAEGENVPTRLALLHPCGDLIAIANIVAAKTVKPVKVMRSD